MVGQAATQWPQLCVSGLRAVHNAQVQVPQTTASHFLQDDCDPSGTRVARPHGPFHCWIQLSASKHVFHSLICIMSVSYLSPDSYLHFPFTF